MQATYKTITACVDKEYLKQSLEELVKAYKETNSARERNKLIATIFCKVYPTFLKIQKRFYSLTKEQKIEHALYHLIKGIQRYKCDKKVKFHTFLQTHWTNQMKSLLTMENSHKKAAFQNIVDNNDEILDYYTQNVATRDFEMTDEYCYMNIKDSELLSTEEKEFCECVLQGYTKTREIADKLQLDKRYGLKRMTNPLVVMDTEKAKAADDKAALRRVRSIRDSIKQKLQKYGKDLF